MAKIFFAPSRFCASLKNDFLPAFICFFSLRDAQKNTHDFVTAVEDSV
jgi:hypothetical protein